MEKRIVFVGDHFVVGEHVRNINYSSSTSLLDGDIIAISPDLAKYRSYNMSTFEGLDCLDDDSSFKLKNDTEHWRKEISAALEDGKTTIVWLRNIPLVKVATGERSFSGTGRNRQTTRIVVTFDIYSFIPADIGQIVRRGGELIRPASDLGILASYWQEFGPLSKYEMYIDGFTGKSLLETQTGSKTIAGILRFKNLPGQIILLPPPPFVEVVEGRVDSIRAKSTSKPSDSAAYKKRLAATRKNAEGSVASQFLAALVEIDKAARSQAETTPPPAWISNAAWSIPQAESITGSLDKNRSAIESLQHKKLKLEAELAEIQSLRDLLFEKGKRLEKAILRALRLLGFTAENLQEGDSEFDAVMIDPSGVRLIGEAEGKDGKAINVDKLDQLDRNLKEDFSRQPDDGATFAHGVLFGNAHRLTPPADRGEFFSAKCLLAAARSSISLVKTTDLFIVARYLETQNDSAFAELCRNAIVESVGTVVKFPAVPQSNSSDQT